MTEKMKMALPRFMQEVLELIEKGDFSTGGPSEPLGVNERVVSEEMTTFERACYIISYGKADQATNVIIERGPLIEENKYVHSLLMAAQTIYKMMLASIKERLDDFFNSDKIGVRAGWKVVKLSEEADCECPACHAGKKLSALAKTRGGFFGGTMSSGFPGDEIIVFQVGPGKDSFGGEEEEFPGLESFAILMKKI